MVTLKEIAARSGASINTVSRALNGKLSESWPKVAARAQAIRDMAREMGYRPNAAAQTMRNQKANNIGVIMSGGYTLEYEVPVLIGLGQVLRRDGYSLTLIHAEDCDPNHLENVPAFREGFLDAVIIEHVPDYLREYASKICDAQIFLDSNIHRKTDCIYRDEYASGLIAAQKTVELGHKKVLYLSHRMLADAHHNVRERRRGCNDGCAEGGCDCEVLEVGFHLDEVAEAGRKLLKIAKKCRAIIASGQGQAQWCANLLAQQGLCAGRDYSLCSCEEKLDCRSVWSGLSRVSFDRINMGVQAADMMLYKIKNGKPKSCKSIVLRGEWIPGVTTCSAAKLKK